VSSPRPEDSKPSLRIDQAEPAPGDGPPRPTLARATEGYDQQFRERLTAALVETIARESMVADANVMAIRTTETADALADAMASMLTLNPAMSVPSVLRKTCEALCKKLRVDVGRARAQGVGDILGASQFRGNA
jgi:hypothetical protein